MKKWKLVYRKRSDSRKQIFVKFFEAANIADAVYQVSNFFLTEKDVVAFIFVSFI